MSQYRRHKLIPRSMVPQQSSSTARRPAPVASASAAASGPDPVAADALQGPMDIVAQLRRRSSCMTAPEVATVLGYSNVKRVYGLPIRHFSVSEGGAGALRWDPNDVAAFIERRRGTTPPTAAA